MSLLPLFFDDSCWGPAAPSNRRRLLDDVFEPLAVVNSLLRSPEFIRDMKNLNSALQQDENSQVSVDKDRFQANFDVQHFKPEEITVKVTGNNSVTVEAKHEEKQDEHGHIYRHFVRKYVLPKDCDTSRLESKLSSDGVLSITAPTIGDKANQQRSIPITRTGKPARSLEKKSEAVEPKKCKI